MEALISPWRMEYIHRGDAPSGCIFCEAEKITEEQERQRYIVYRGKFCFVMMNAYPYNPYHVLIAPYRHTAAYESLSAEEGGEFFGLSQRAVSLLREISQAHGFNLGMNLGRVAGAGIDQHLHLHVVPRWTGDSNFMPVIADTRTIPAALEECYQTLRERWAREE